MTVSFQGQAEIVSVIQGIHVADKNSRRYRYQRSPLTDKLSRSIVTAQKQVRGQECES